ncbi:hypothetical protein ACH4XT_15190 [Streptomyces avidinii]|uniref:hypothetical protein n=1 Tax=Streptomyces avidinii TaxID=1895 RepID=UPI00379DA646
MPSAHSPADPFLVEIWGSGYGRCAAFSTMDDAYAAARAIREQALTEETVAFTDRFGHEGLYRVLGVGVRRRNRLTGRLLAHARSWNLGSERADALLALPDDWYDEPLPEDWRSR